MIGYIKMAEDYSKEVLAGFIIISIIAVIMLLYIAKVKQESWNLAEKELCKKSVEFQAQQRRLLTASGSDLTDYNGNKVDLKCYTQYKKIKSKEDRTVKKTIADAMYHCWDQYGKGEYDLFDTKDNNYCVVCSSLEFTRKKEITGLSEFLINEKPSKVSKKTYFEFLNGINANSEETLKIYENSDLKNKDKLNLKNPLAVMFVSSKNAYPNARFGAEHGKLGTVLQDSMISAISTTGVLAITGCISAVACAVVIGVASIGGVAIGYFSGSDISAEWDSHILIWDYNKLYELDCTRLEGKSTPIQPYQMNKYK